MTTDESSLPFYREYTQANGLDNAAIARARSSEQLDLFDKEVIENVRQDNEAFFPGGRYFEPLSEAILRQSLDADTLFDIGVTIGADINQTTRSAKGRIVRYLNTVANLDRLKVGLIGGQRRYGNDKWYHRIHTISRCS